MNVTPNIEYITRRARVAVVEAREALKECQYSPERHYAALRLKLALQHLRRCETTRRERNNARNA